MLHKPTQRKGPKKYDHSEKAQQQQLKKQGIKPLMRAASNALANKNNERPSSVKGRVAKVQKKLDGMTNKISNNELQNLLIEQIKGIKNELKQIKQHIGIHSSNNKISNIPPQRHNQRQQQDEQESIYQHQQNNSQNQAKIQEYNQPITHGRMGKKAVTDSQHNEQVPKINGNFKLFQKPKQLMDVGKIQPYMKQFKIQVSKSMLPLYYGYHKKSSKPVVIKYCPQSQSMQSLFNLYEKLWKNIVKAKSKCINKVYDLNEPLATYILVIQANKFSLSQILSNRVANVAQILCSLVKALQFFHQCGYLYRNMHPNHVMSTYQNDIVVIDLKNVKRYVDIKGKHMNVTQDTNQIQDEFISNSRARGLKQGRKDDLQSLGYLALFIMQGSLPWNINNLIQVRSKLTLKQLCGKYPALLQYMIIVSQMQTEDVPNYQKLSQCLSNI